MTEPDINADPFRLILRAEPDDPRWWGPPPARRARPLRWVLAAGAVTVLAATIGLAALGARTPTAYGARIDLAPWERVRCEEDMACWQCETMGNRVCGPPPTAATAPEADPAR